MVEARDIDGEAFSMAHHLGRWGRKGLREWYALWRRVEPVAWTIAAGFPLLTLRPARWRERHHLHPWKRLWVLARPNLLPKYLGLFAVAALAVLVWQMPHLMDLVGAIWPNPESLEAGSASADPRLDTFRHAAWRLLVAAGAAVAFFALLLWAWQTLTKYRSAQVDRRRQETETFTLAFQNLGSASFATRLGAIHNLERLAQTSPELHEPIIESFCSYLQQENAIPDTDLNDDDETQTKALRTNRSSFPVDFQSLVNALGRRNLAHERSVFWLDVEQLDLGGADLNYADLRRLILVRTRFDQAFLCKARLDNANLSHCVFDRAEPADAVFDDADLNAARFDKALLSGARFRRADLTNATFVNALVAMVSFDRAHLFRPDFRSADLADASFEEAELLGANFENAALYGTNFRRADLRGADFAGADLADPDCAPIFSGALVDEATTGLPDWALGQVRYETSG